MNSVGLISTYSTKPLDISIENILKKVEFLRIQTHLQLTEKLLRKKSVDHLSKTLQKKRLEHLDTLHSYWKQGIFPRNTDFAELTPYFRDSFGTLCAMAYLVQQSGRGDLVDMVQDTDNNIRIRNLSHGPLLNWIKQSGLTQEEAAQIQPSYSCEWTHSCPVNTITPYLPYIPWIILGVILIVLEVLSYFVSHWIAQGNRDKRLVSWIYFTFINIFFSVMVMFVVTSIFGIRLTLPSF